MELFYDISIIIFNLNDSLFLERCIRSCLAQTLPGYSYNIFVVIEKGQNISKKIIDHYKDHIIPVCIPKRTDFAKAFEGSLNQASGRYIVLAEATDFFSDYCLLFQTVFLYDNPNYDGVSVDYWLVEKDSDTKTKRLSSIDMPLLYGVMYRKETILREIIYKHNFKRMDEDSLKIVLEKDAKIGHIPISFYRRQMKDAAENS